MKNFDLIKTIKDFDDEKSFQEWERKIREIEEIKYKISLQYVIRKLIMFFSDEKFKNVEKIKFDADAYYDDNGVNIMHFWVNTKIKGKSWNPEAKYTSVFSGTIEGDVQSYFNSTTDLPFVRDLVKDHWILSDVIERKNLNMTLNRLVSFGASNNKKLLEDVFDVLKKEKSLEEVQQMEKLLKKPAKKTKVKI